MTWHKSVRYGSGENTPNIDHLREISRAAIRLVYNKLPDFVAALWFGRCTNEPRRSYSNWCGDVAEEASQGLWDNPGPTTSGSASSDVVINEVD